MIDKSKKKHTGNFKQRGTFEYVTITNDNMGGGTEAWSALADAWLNIKPMRGSQRLQLQAQKVSTTHTIQARYRGDLDLLGYANKKYDNELRLKYGDRYFNIQYVINEDEENYFFEMAAEEA